MMSEEQTPKPQKPLSPFRRYMRVFFIGAAMGLVVYWLASKLLF